jgi:hypothetical protein
MASRTKKNSYNFWLKNKKKLNFLVLVYVADEPFALAAAVPFAAVVVDTVVDYSFFLEFLCMTNTTFNFYV